MSEAPRTVAVFRALQLGDMLCCVPAMRALKAAWPAARVTLIGLPWAQAFVRRYPMLFACFEAFPGAPGFPEQDESGARLGAFTARMRKRRFDMAIQLHGSGGPANDIVMGFGARHCAGFVQQGELRPGTFIAWPDALSEPKRYLALMQRLGIEALDERLWLPLDASDREECDRLLRARRIEASRLVVVHPGAQLPSRRWPADRFAGVADALAADGWTIAITGTCNESDIAAALIDRMSHRAADLVGATTLGGLAALVARARLVICNDTGLSHVAAAMQAPSVVVACGSDVRRWAPANAVLHRVLARHPHCRPCSFTVCPYAHECAREISVAEVIEAARAQLAAHASTRSSA